ncbi:hypothetical protein I5R65_14690 [Herbaspirillum sp. AP02]|uniref:hypothetical protein n=1 Tax=unclassified Herbaspirillum TaxID=2624150 RepID=UPI0015DB9E7B|nr:MULTISPECIES: hypothetical protein [unclassified Herbaspirillum]MBG7620714.1 hypothetical protein [Herbaspirillum sp. AP02]NZD68179.1 hypothetical protein [Herbaspirillum sp. AP21]
MNKMDWLGTLRCYVSVVSSAIALGIAWGMLGAFGGRFLFGLQEVQALLFVGLPVGLLVVVLMWKRLPRILGFDE